MIAVIVNLQSARTGCFTIRRSDKAWVVRLVTLSVGRRWIQRHPHQPSDRLGA